MTDTIEQKREEDPPPPTPLSKLMDCKLTAPPDPAVCWDILALSETNWNRARVAALGVAWRGSGRPGIPYDAQNPAGFAGRVLKVLLDRGLSYGDILGRGMVAYGVIGASVVTPEQLEEAEGNSEAEAEGSPA